MKPVYGIAVLPGKNHPVGNICSTAHWYQPQVSRGATALAPWYSVPGTPLIWSSMANLVAQPL
jgi:hypothetical protein